MAHLSRDDRRRLVHALLETHAGRSRQPRLQLCGGHRRRRAARGDRSGDDGVARLPGLFLVGEILDVDGRLGGFNFQWAWSSAWVAAQAVRRGAVERLLDRARVHAEVRGRPDDLTVADEQRLRRLVADASREAIALDTSRCVWTVTIA